jgi:3-hydroxyisobutyrate dehydrogenase-like beta-hydroxyacid dehydrogenase
MKKIAVLGLGAMGVRMASRLLTAGHQLTVFNRTPGRAIEVVARGAKLAATPREAATDADVVVSCVTDDQASRSVWLDREQGALASLSASAIAIESSTLTPAWVRELGAQVMERRAAFLDAPVSGSLPQAEAGQLVYLVGGDVQTLERARDTLLAMGETIHHIGPMGTGAVMKLAVNALLGIEVAALAEVLQLAQRAGIATDEAHAVISQTAVASPVMKVMGKLIAERQFAPQFPVDLVRKDLRYAVATIEQLGGHSQVLASARDAYAKASAAGYGGDNITGVAKVYDDARGPLSSR